ncbi:MAG TPA: RimK/LysX family protein [Thermoanaerobaculia bacterium]|nr:RimK/LysX family protein [Thermoanaerobaculia bacterium]
MAVKPKRRPAVGWREWAALPDLGIAAIKVKVDTGARSSALHAFDLVRVDDEDGAWVEFAVHPLQRDACGTVRTRARLLDERWVRSSSGRRTFRPVIATTMVLGGNSWPIELTLVRRDLMGFRMLVGREALRRRLVVDPGRSYLAGEPVLAARTEADAGGDAVAEDASTTRQLAAAGHR